MLSCELGKELKDSGFPQTIESERSGGVHIPLLSELIKACGNDIQELENTFDGWRSYSSRDSETFWAKTPEEAVAHLWLALNKK